MADQDATTPTVAELATLPWAEEAPGIHSRATTVDGARWALVRYGPGAERDEWCTDGHRGVVVQGAMAYELADGRRLEAPEHCGIWLPCGLGHRGVNGAQETLLFLIDVPDPAGP